MAHKPAPSCLDDRARAKWWALTSAHDFADHELDPLAAYCAAFGRFEAAQEWLADPEHDCIMTILDDKGQVKSHGIVPQVGLSERSSREMTRLSKVLKLGRRKPRA